VCGTFVYIISIHYLFHFLKNRLKATFLAWFPDNETIIHKYLAEMRRLAHDETPFLLVVQLRATTLAWWLDDGNVIPLNTYDHDRMAHDKTSHPPISPLSIHYHSIL
jgi:hypothetical protein